MNSMPSLRDESNPSTPLAGKRPKARIGSFDELATYSVLENYAEAFLKATGIPFLKLLPPEAVETACAFEKGGNPFCLLVASSLGKCNGCAEGQASLSHKTPQQSHPDYRVCFLGLNTFTIPIMEGSRHVATLISGQVFLKKPTETDFKKIVASISPGRSREWLKQARESYFQTPVIPMEKLLAIVQLLASFAATLPDSVRKSRLSSSSWEHQAVSRAKEFIQTRSDEQISLEQVVRHVHISRYHFCKLFRRSTDMTLMDYIAQVRLARARTLLLDPSLRISDIVFASGFGSISQFNSLFKRFVGVSPTEYRLSRRSQISC